VEDKDLPAVILTYHHRELESLENLWREETQEQQAPSQAGSTWKRPTCLSGSDRRKIKKIWARQGISGAYSNQGTKQHPTLGEPRPRHLKGIGQRIPQRMQSSQKA